MPQKKGDGKEKKEDGKDAVAAAMCYFIWKDQRRKFIYFRSKRTSLNIRCKVRAPDELL